MTRDFIRATSVGEQSGNLIPVTFQPPLQPGERRELDRHGSELVHIARVSEGNIGVYNQPSDVVDFSVDPSMSRDAFVETIAKDAAAKLARPLMMTTVDAL